MAKTTKSSTNGTENFETALHTGAEAVKDGFERAAKGYEQFVTFGKDTAEAMMKSANAAGKGIESFNSEVFAYARKSVEDSVSATKAIMAAKSVDEAIQLQTEFGKNAFEMYVDELAKFGDMTLALARESAEPLQARFTAFATLVRAS
jgi:phasin family protein